MVTYSGASRGTSHICGYDCSCRRKFRDGIPSSTLQPMNPFRLGSKIQTNRYGTQNPYTILVEPKT